MSNGIELLLSDARGIYIPRDFSQEFNLNEWGISLDDETLECLSDPHNNNYWDVWQYILDNAVSKDKDGKEWRLIQDGDLFAYCEELMSDEDYKNFFGEDRN